MSNNTKLREIAAKLPQHPKLSAGKPVLTFKRALGFYLLEDEAQKKIIGFCKSAGFDSFEDFYSKRRSSKYIALALDVENRIDTSTTTKETDDKKNPVLPLSYYRIQDVILVNHFKELKKHYKEGGIEKVNRYIKFVIDYNKKQQERNAKQDTTPDSNSPTTESQEQSSEIHT